MRARGGPGLRGPGRTARAVTSRSSHDRPESGYRLPYRRPPSSYPKLYRAENWSR
jgi:hypothetical protein